MPTGSASWLLSVPSMILLGLVVGSFLNVVIRRLPLMLYRQWWGVTCDQLEDEESLQALGVSAGAAPARQCAERLRAQLQELTPLDLSFPRSHCPACHQTLRLRDLIPVASWLALGGRCAACGNPISLRYPLVELMSAALFGILAGRFSGQWVLLAWCTFAAVLLVAACIDWETLLLPDVLTQGLLWLGLALAALGATVDPVDAIAGAVGGYLLLWSVAMGYRLVTGQDGMGQGDFKLLAALGAWLGWSGVLPVVVLASLSAALIGMGLRLGGRLKEGRLVPFGPFLAAAALVMVCWQGSQAGAWWLSQLR